MVEFLVLKIPNQKDLYHQMEQHFIKINRGKSKKYSCSNRIASLMGNGLLTFMDNQKQFDHFFTKKEIIFFKNQEDLLDKLNFYKINSKERKIIAKKGQKKYFKLFNEREVADYIVKRSFGETRYKPIWEK